MNMIGFMSERTKGEPSVTDVSANMARNTSHLQRGDTQVGDKVGETMPTVDNGYSRGERWWRDLLARRCIRCFTSLTSPLY